MEKVEVKYLGVVVGYTYDGQTIEFLNNELSKEVQSTLLGGNSIGISSRRMGTVDESGRVSYEKITEYGVINHLDSLKSSRRGTCHCGNPINQSNPDCVEFSLCKDCAMEA